MKTIWMISKTMWRLYSSIVGVMAIIGFTAFAMNGKLDKVVEIAEENANEFVKKYNP